jgi:hypothetical protein
MLQLLVSLAEALELPVGCANWRRRLRPGFLQPRAMEVEEDVGGVVGFVANTKSSR